MLHSAASVKCHVGATKNLPVVHHNAEFIYFPCDHYAQSGNLENQILLMLSLEGIYAALQTTLPSNEESR